MLSKYGERVGQTQEEAEWVAEDVVDSLFSNAESKVAFDRASDLAGAVVRENNLAVKAAVRTAIERRMEEDARKFYRLFPEYNIGSTTAAIEESIAKTYEEFLKIKKEDRPSSCYDQVKHLSCTYLLVAPCTRNRITRRILVDGYRRGGLDPVLMTFGSMYKAFGHAHDSDELERIIQKMDNHYAITLIEARRIAAFMYTGGIAPKYRYSDEEWERTRGLFGLLFNDELYQDGVDYNGDISSFDPHLRECVTTVPHPNACSKYKKAVRAL